MSAESLESPQPTCEKCWLKQHSHWEPESVDSDGNILMRLKSVDIPVKYNTGAVETCSNCGEMTVCGIYELKNPDVKFFSSGSNQIFGLPDGSEEEGL
jgi:hypothetical protein